MFALAPIILSALAISAAWTDDEVETVALLTTPWEGPVETETAVKAKSWGQIKHRTIDP